MSLLKSWTGGAIVLLALAGGLRAEVMVGQSEDPALEAPGLLSVLRAERSALDSVPESRLAKIASAPQAAPGSAAGPVASGAQPGQPGRITRAWLRAQPAPKPNAQLSCLASAIYHEARGESLEGQQAVAEVVLNRVDDGMFPKTVCGVVEQRAQGGCQFSFTCDGKSDQPGNRASYALAEKIAAAMLNGFPRRLTDGATYFHVRGLKPSWSRRFTLTADIGAHRFYRRPVMTASN